MERLENSFAEFLALDIFAHLKTHSDENVCLMVDTLERLEPDLRGDACERCFQDLCGRLVNSPIVDENGRISEELQARSGIVLFGREKLRWQRYDLPGTSDPWSNYISTYELTGFTKPVALHFLRNEYRRFWQARAPEVAEQLQNHEGAILEASDEREGASTYLPYYLRLAGEMNYEQGEHFVPEMLGHSPDEMQQRFVGYLRGRSPDKFAAMRMLALALYFGDDLFDYLVRGNYISGMPVHGMVPALLGDRRTCVGSSPPSRLLTGSIVTCNRPCWTISGRVRRISRSPTMRSRRSSGTTRIAVSSPHVPNARCRIFRLTNTEWTYCCRIWKEVGFLGNGRIIGWAALKNHLIFKRPPRFGRGCWSVQRPCGPGSGDPTIPHRLSA